MADGGPSYGQVVRLLGLELNDLDSAGILHWTTRSVDVVRYAALPAAVRAGVSGWLGTVAGAPGQWAMACVDSGHGTDAIPLGLLAGLLWDTLQAEGVLHHSNLLPSALGERMRQLADAVRIAVSGLRTLGGRVRDLFAAGSPDRDRVRSVVDETYVALLADAVTGKLGGKVGVAPRVFLKKLVADVLDRVELHPDFDPRQHYRLTLSAAELTDVERNAAGLAVRGVDDIELELP